MEYNLGVIDSLEVLLDIDHNSFTLWCPQTSSLNTGENESFGVLFQGNFQQPENLVTHHLAVNQYVHPAFRSNLKMKGSVFCLAYHDDDQIYAVMSLADGQPNGTSEKWYANNYAFVIALTSSNFTSFQYISPLFELGTQHICELSPNSQLVAHATDYEIGITSLDEQHGSRLIHTCPMAVQKGLIDSLTWSASSDKIVFGFYLCLIIQIFNLKDATSQKIDLEKLDSSAFSFEILIGKWILTNTVLRFHGLDKIIVMLRDRKQHQALFDVEKMTLISKHAIKHDRDGISSAVSPDASCYLITEDKKIKIIDLSNGQVVAKLTNVEGCKYRYWFDRYGRRIIVWKYFDNEEGKSSLDIYTSA